MTIRLATMTVSKLLRHAAAAAAAVVILGTFQGPSDPSSRIGCCSLNSGYIWAVEAAGSNGPDGEEGASDLGAGGGGSDGSDTGKGNDKNSPIEQVNGEDEHGDKDKGNNKQKAAGKDDPKKQNSLRGSAATSSHSTPLKAPDDDLLERIFSSFPGFERGMGHPLAEQAKEAKAFNELIDKIFVPRLQTPPKYPGALECVNDSMYRDMLNGPNKVKDNPHLLKQAYNALRRSPVVIPIPELFVELRREADKHIWEQVRKKEIRVYQQRGEPIPERLELSAEEVEARDAEEPRLREEDLSETDLASRTIMIEGWMKEQFRLRLYYKKRIGLLKGDPQELVETFNPGPKYVAVSVEEILGLGYEAELDPEPHIDDSSPQQRSSARAAEF